MKRAVSRGVRYMLPAALFAGALFLGSSCTTTMDAVTGQGVWNIYSIQEDVALGKNTVKGSVDQAREAGVAINADSARLAQLNEMMHRIASVSDMPQLPYEVTLFHTNIVNAAAAPGGSLMVFEGLYDPEIGLVHDEDELAAVMAHEVAHVNCRHSTERLSTLMTVGLLAEIGAAVAEHNDEDDIADALRIAFVVGSVFYIPIHSQRDEFEADRVGLFYMAKAGYDPRAAPRIWRRVAEKQGQEHNEASIFATHPSCWDRYEALEKMVPYAMMEYAAATGSYPADYTPPDWFNENAPTLDWRNPAP